MQKTLTPDEEFEVLRRLEQCSYLCGGSAEIEYLKSLHLVDGEGETGHLTLIGRLKLLQHRARVSLDAVVSDWNYGEMNQ